MSGRHNHDQEIRQIIKSEFKQALLSAVNGDLEFKITPETINTVDELQNVGEHQEITATIAGLVTGDGGGDIKVTVKAKVLDGGELVLDDVTVGNNNDSNAIAAAIQAALVENEQFSADGNSGVIQATVSESVITLKMIEEAAQDDSFTMELDEQAVGFVDALDADIETVQEGVAPYTRKVVVELVDSEGNRHWWFTGEVPVTIGEVTAGDGVAEVVEGLTPEMRNGILKLTVRLRGDWSGADSDTNTLTVSQKTILGETVTEVTSVETSITS